MLKVVYIASGAAEAAEVADGSHSMPTIWARAMEQLGAEQQQIHVRW